MKHTPGKVTVYYNTTGDLPYKYVLSNNQETDEEAEANAELIAEAFNVTDECGLTPRQLLEQRNEFLDALKLIDVLYGDREDFIEPYKSAWDKAKQAIKNATTPPEQQQ